MQKNFYRTIRYDADHTGFGGRISTGDFDRKSSIAEITGKIISDLCFDRECERNAKSRDFNQKLQ